MVLKKIGVWSAAKVAGALYCAIGLIIGCIVALVSLLGAGFIPSAGQDGLPVWMGALLGIGAIVFLPLLYGVLGLIFGAIAAALYNVFARMVGGLRIDLE